MIIVKLTGGLGNQMFQYAIGKWLSLKHNVVLKLDTSALDNSRINTTHSIRNYALNNFNITAQIATCDECKYFEKSKAAKLINLISLYLPISKRKFYLREPSFSFFKMAVEAPPNCYVDGYWQSEKYFNSIRTQLIKDFTASKPMTAQSDAIADKIKSESSVSIHVRRGDYITIAQNKNLYEVCSESYYYEAINLMSEKISNPTFYIFSEEPEWFKNNIKVDFPVVYVTHNRGEKSYEDLILMSLCKHNIIANSSFSWWGAWLNANANKMVIAPKNWFKDKSKNTRDLIPENWYQL